MIRDVVNRWRPAIGFPGYEVSDRGVIRSARKILRPSPSHNGYLRVRLWRAGRRRNVRVHLLVLRAFIGPRPSRRHHGAHCDGNLKNNRLSNLAWKLPKANEADKKVVGTAPRGFSGHRGLDPREVYELLAEDLSYSQIGARLGLHRSSVSRIARGLRHRPKLAKCGLKSEASPRA